MTSEKVTPRKKVEKGNKIFDDTEEPVVTTRRKDLDNFEGQSIRSTCWFNLDHEWLKRKFIHLNWTSTKNVLKRILNFKILKHIKPL